MPGLYKNTAMSETNWESNPSLLKRSHQERMVDVRIVDGVHHVFMPDGSHLPLVIKTTVEDHFDECPKVTVTMFCNLVGESKKP